MVYNIMSYNFQVICILLILQHRFCKKLHRGTTYLSSVFLEMARETEAQME